LAKLNHLYIAAVYGIVRHDTFDQLLLNLCQNSFMAGRRILLLGLDGFDV